MMIGSPVVLANRFFVNVRFKPCPRAVPAKTIFIKLRRDVVIVDSSLNLFS